MKSIKNRLLGSHFIVILLTVLILEMVLWVSIKNYYYNSIESVLEKEAQIGSNLYKKYLVRDEFQKAAEDLMESFFYSEDAQVQIIDKDNRIIIDSVGLAQGTEVETDDVKEALRGNHYTWKGKVEYTNEDVMAVSYPISLDKNVVGVIRFVTSLKKVNALLERIMITLIIIGIIVVLSITIVSCLISNTITKPLNAVTNTAKEMAKGNFSVKAVKKYNDEIGSMADTLNYMAEEIEKNEKLKNDFISSISHELRTPLTSIKGWALTLKLKEFTDPIKRMEGLDIIVEESERLSSLVEELLDFSRFQSGRISLNIGNVDIKRLVESIAVQMKPKANKNGIDLICNMGNMPVIKGDKNRLKQVFINIIDNAIKFTEKGGSITVTSILEHDYIQIIIKDNGIGIDRRELPEIKNKFYKGKSKSSGSGIGLAICDEIIRLHGGSIEIESHIGKGTTVKVLIK